MGWSGFKVGGGSQQLEAEAAKLQKQIDKLLDLLIEADSCSVVRAYEKRIEMMEQDNRLIEQRIVFVGSKPDTFRKSFEHAIRFLANPYEIWEKGNLDLKRNVIALAFSEPLV
ncbi:hypothetical protein [uncultured Roseobacter sp.]|uniref:hypothetical protein n=1 Tax=uncultured Roseobacter sp. TaxID=114847 RepID=UPI0026371E1C|nr:hypothetical protein [uncultured Roseobacter sp.]